MNKPKKRGRPPSDNPKVRMPGMLVSPEQLSAYKQAADASDLNFSQWVRSTLDKAAKKNRDQSMSNNFDTGPIKQAINAIQSEDPNMVGEAVRAIRSLIISEFKEGQTRLLPKLKKLSAYLEYRQKSILAELKGTKMNEPKSLLSEEALALCQNILNANTDTLDITRNH